MIYVAIRIRITRSKCLPRDTVQPIGAALTILNALSNFWSVTKKLTFAAALVGFQDLRITETVQMLRNFIRFLTVVFNVVIVKEVGRREPVQANKVLKLESCGRNVYDGILFSQ